MECWAAVRLVRDTEYTPRDLEAAVEGVHGELEDRDRVPAGAYSPARGVYVVDARRWVLAVEMYPHLAPELCDELGRAFLDPDGRSVVCAVAVWGPELAELIWPPEAKRGRRDRKPWDREPGWWKPDSDGPSSGPSAGGLFAGGMGW